MNVLLSLLAILWSAGPAWAGHSLLQRVTDPRLYTAQMPNIGVTVWFQGQKEDHGGVEGEDHAVFELKEAEIAFQSAIADFARGDVFVGVGDHGAEVEEGHLTLLKLPAGLSFKLGKFNSYFGRFNRLHGSDTMFADRPLVAEKYLGEHSMSGVGLSASWHIPNPWVIADLTAEVTAPPGEVPSFKRAEREDLLVVGRLGASRDLSDSATLSVGGSWALGPAGQEFNAASNSSSTLHTRLYGADLLLRWSPRGASGVGAWTLHSEVLWSRLDRTASLRTHSLGAFSTLDWQAARKWHVGVRHDWSESPADGERHEKGGLAYVMFVPSEFAVFSLQGRRVKRFTGETETTGFLKVVFLLGRRTPPFLLY